MTPSQTSTSPKAGQPASNGEQVGEQIPPLCNGDHLDRVEFERRYNAMPHVKKAELIEGVVYMPSPVSLDNHADQHSLLTWWLVSYRFHTPGVRTGDNGTVRLDMDNEPQPDAFLLIEPARGGRTTNEGGYVVGGPELACEVAASSVSMDRNAKMNAYRRNGVCEYLLWRVQDQAIDWFVLRGGRYDLLPAGTDGIIRSEVLPGLWLDAQALVTTDLPRVQAVLQQGIASPEHAAFVAQLQATHSGS
jgi:hypothetical protein